MKRISLPLMLAALALSPILYGQNWITHNGNNERNGLTAMTGPQNANSPLWTITNAFPSSLGMNIYSFGDRFVTSRVDFSPYSALIECRDLKTGQLIWSSPDLGSESILYAMGFNEDAVYAHDYHSNLFYALNTADGTIKWVSNRPSYTFGPMDGVIYTCERDIIINGELGSVDESTLCLSKETGEILWTNANWFAITPNETKAAHGDRLYMIAGAINQPKQLVAVDMRNGDNLYYSEDLPGDGDQEGPIAVSPDGRIYFRRDGGNFFAVEDNGNGFDILWTYTPLNMGLFVMNYGIEPDGNILIMDNQKIFRLDRNTGTVLDSSNVSGISAGRIAIGADSTVYIDDTDGKYYALSYDLQTLKWQVNLAGNYYAGPALSKDGIMVVCGAGSGIKAYQYPGPHSPLADFAASFYHIYTGESVDFIDQSSFSPNSWQWEFPGGTPSTSTDQHPQDILYEQPGTYEVKLTVSNALGNDQKIKNCYIEVELLDDMADFNAPPSGFIYPNPGNDFVTIKNDGTGEIYIFNALGQVIMSKYISQDLIILDTKGFPEGFYFVRLQGNGIVRQGKLIVKH